MVKLFCAALLAAPIACSAQTKTPADPKHGGASAPAGRANLATTPPPFRIETIGQFDGPFAMAFLPDGRLLVSEKAGKLKLREANGVVELAGVPAVAAGGQGGLLDVAVAPDYARSNVIYLTFAEPGSAGSQLALVRAKIATDISVCDRAPCPPPLREYLTDLAVIWRSGSAGKGGQFGARIAFAPDGRSLFLSSGERQRFTPAQDPDQALGKILHLTLDGKPWPGDPGAGRMGAPTVRVTDPPRNTVVARIAATRTVPARAPNSTPAETWSSGHRNPYGLAFDASGRLWETEMGPQGGDELNLIQPGRNYGWPNASMGLNYDNVAIADHRAGDGYEPPRLWWNPSISPGGMMIYSGKMWPAWKGNAFIAALSGQALIRVTLNGDAPAPGDQWDMGTRIRDVKEAPDGAIWLLEDGERGAGGKLMRLTPK